MSCPSEKLEKEYDGENGTVVEMTKKGPVVKVANGGLRLLEIKFEGKKLQSGADVVNGRKMAVGEKLF